MSIKARILSDFIGAWRLEKTILQADGSSGSFRGTALWTLHATGAEYHETGEMRLGTQPSLHAERRYLWSDALDVFFDDGRFFHTVPALGGAASHWCDPDQYDVVYDFANWPVFTVVWGVKGPRKDYEMRMSYTRI